MSQRKAEVKGSRVQVYDLLALSAPVMGRLLSRGVRENDAGLCYHQSHGDDVQGGEIAQTVRYVGQRIAHLIGRIAGGIDPVAVIDQQSARRQLARVALIGYLVKAQNQVGGNGLGEYIS